MRAAAEGGKKIKAALNIDTMNMNASNHVFTKSSASHNHYYDGAHPNAEKKAKSEAVAEANAEKKIIKTITKTEGKSVVNSVTDTKAAEVSNAIASVAVEAEKIAAKGQPEKA